MTSLVVVSTTHSSIRGSSALLVSPNTLNSIHSTTKLPQRQLGARKVLTARATQHYQADY
jgi:hypothetical protein